MSLDVQCIDHSPMAYTSKRERKLVIHTKKPSYRTTVDKKRDEFHSLYATDLQNSAGAWIIEETSLFYYPWLEMKYLDTRTMKLARIWYVACPSIPLLFFIYSLAFFVNFITFKSR